MTDFADVQRVVLHPPKGDHVAHAVLRFPDSAAGGAWLQEVCARRWLAFGERGDERTHGQMSLGLTFEGLRRLLVPSGYLAAMARTSRAFAEGAPRRAAEHLGDSGASAAALWDSAYRADRAHALLTIHAKSARRLARCLGAVKELARRCGVELIACSQGARLSPRYPDNNNAAQSWVHFGYRDGLSRVGIRGLLGSYVDEAGEFVFGHANNHGSNPWLLPQAPARIRAFFRHGSFGILRLIEQNIEAFDEAVDGWATQVERERMVFDADESTHAQWRAYVKAKLCGRWPEGMLFDQDGEKPAHSLPAADFRHAGDERGVRCPFGSHIRRMNPRQGAAVPKGAVHAQHRPLIRRGTPYGSWQDPQRGLLGWFFCACIEDQFEHLLGQWANRPPLGQAVRGKDPLIGRHEPGDDGFDIPRGDAQADTESHRLTGLQPFCTTRGTLYAFYPSRDAVERLATADYQLKDEIDEDGS
jgi:deferrochelatase/peroxidase EfeB